MSQRTLLFLGLLLVYGTTFAQTPNGQTPAEEAICDPLLDEGVTKGLYGLCVAYCEAHDAEFLSPTGNPAELDVPSRKILDAYNDRKAAGDPDMPCVQTGSCPCFTFDLLGELTPPTPLQANTNFPGACHDGGFPSQGDVITLIECKDPTDPGGPCNWQVAAWDSPLYGFSCFANNPNSATFGGPPGAFIGLTQEQYDSCADLIRERAAVDATWDVWYCFLP